VDIDKFSADGYLVVRGAVDEATVAECRSLIWRELALRGVLPDDPHSWPVLAEIDGLDGEPFAKAGLAPALREAYDALIGPGRWRRVDVGRALMVRFPAAPTRLICG